MWVDLLITCVIWIVCGLTGIQLSLMSGSEDELRDFSEESGMKEFMLFLVGGPCTLVFAIVDLIEEKWKRFRKKHPSSIWHTLVEREIKRRHKKRK